MVVYIHKSLTFKYTIQILNLCNSYIFSNIKLTHNFFILTTLIVITMNNKEKMVKLRERCIVLVIISATEQGLLLLYSFDTLPSPKPNVLNPHSLLQGLTANNLSLSITHGRHFLNPQVLPHTHNFHFPTKPHNSTPPPLSSSFLPKTLTPFHL